MAAVKPGWWVSSGDLGPGRRRHRVEVSRDGNWSARCGVTGDDWQPVDPDDEPELFPACEECDTERAEHTARQGLRR